MCLLSENQMRSMFQNSDPPVHYQSQVNKEIFQEILNATTEATTIVTPKATLEESYITHLRLFTPVSNSFHKLAHPTEFTMFCRWLDKPMLNRTCSLCNPTRTSRNQKNKIYHESTKTRNPGHFSFSCFHSFVFCG